MTTLIGGVTVLSVQRDSTRKRDRVYRVRYACCGAEGELTHDVLMRRQQEGVSKCRACVGKKTPPDRGSPRRSDHSFRMIDEMPYERRPRLPSAESILALWERANARVRERTA